MTANGHPVVSERTMPMTAAATAPSQQTISKLNEADAALIQKVASSDPKEFETPSAGQLTRFKEAKKSSIWGRDWTLPAGILLEHPPGDYRDQLPPPMAVVAQEFKDIPQNGDWTFGLLEMWGKRSKIVKSAVHVPCWEAFTWYPWKWRGLCFGRTFHQCFWLGVDRTRWARLVYGAGLGREYKVPCAAVPESHYKGRIAALCMFQCCITESASVGFGQFVAPGGCILNFAACYTCHGREKIRRKYNLPATFGLPPGFDDCCTHFICMYCASHQEARELVVRGVDGPGLKGLKSRELISVDGPGFEGLNSTKLFVRGVDGPGMHVLDVTPLAFKHLPGWEKAVAERETVRLALQARPPGEFQTMGRRIWSEPGAIGGYARPNRAAQAAAVKMATSSYQPMLTDGPSSHK